MKHFRNIAISIFALSVITVPWMSSVYPQGLAYVDKAFEFFEKNVAAVMLHNPLTIQTLQKKYDTAPRTKKKVRILVMPGHEPGYGGAEYRDLKEREMNVELAGYLAGFISNNLHYEAVVARTDEAWNPDIKSYFDTQWDEITTFVKDNKENMLHLVNTGQIARPADPMLHNKAPQNVGLRLHGINKWVNENAIDIAIHIHFNDYPRHDANMPGKYSGFSIYVPESQYANSTTTQAIADSVFRRLGKYNAVSNLPKERAGIIEEQDLIAIGTYNTLDVPSMLIEYGYIYQPEFADPAVRSTTLKDLAFQTYLGLQDFFGSGNDVSLAYDTLMLPYKWIGEGSRAPSDKNEVLALQTALLLEGVYPPQSMDKNDCPRSGKFGPCTATALSDFQKKHGITGEKDVVGDKTRSALNTLYSVQIR